MYKRCSKSYCIYTLQIDNNIHTVIVVLHVCNILHMKKVYLYVIVDRNDLMLLRNIIFAKHGYAFKKRPLRIYFESQPWYIPVSTNVKNELTYIEKENIKTILRYEKYNEYQSDYAR